MSADSWNVCPACYDTAVQDHEERREVVADLYGKVSVDEFDAARAELEDAPRSESFEKTWRENYEFYIVDGEVFVSYSGRCTNCGLSTDMEHSKKFWPE